MCICFDNTGSNISIKGDGHIGGHKYLCASGTTPHHKLSETEGHFMAHGVTAFNQEPIGGVVIIMVNNNKDEVESGINIFAELIRGENDADCFEKITSRSNDFQ